MIDDHVLDGVRDMQVMTAIGLLEDVLVSLHRLDLGLLEALADQAEQDLGDLAARGLPPARMARLERAYRLRLQMLRVAMAEPDDHPARPKQPRWLDRRP